MALLLLARLCRADQAARPRLWLLLGVVLSVGLLNKLSVGALGVGIAAALVLTPLRSDLGTRSPWLAVGLVLALVAPHVLWQLRNHWPTVEFVRNAARLKNVTLGPVGFLLAQVHDFGP